ncbi:hypothetical protein GW17_00031318 [Ensete ventricosum]|nr:hypothetical protein GW17_00031318 [Ensete ventricosum]
MRFACFPSEVIAPLRKVETSLGEVRPPLISFIALVVRGHFYISCLSLLALIPPFLDHRTEESCPSGSEIGRSDPSSSSSGIMTLTDVRAFKALEIMKLCHDFDSTGSDRAMTGRGWPKSSFSGYVIYPCSIGFQCLIYTTYYSNCRDGEFELGARSAEGGGRASQLHRSDPGLVRHCSFFPTRSLGDFTGGGDQEGR